MDVDLYNSQFHSLLAGSSKALDTSSFFDPKQSHLGKFIQILFIN